MESTTRGNVTKFRDRSGREIGSAIKRGNTTQYYTRSGKRVKSLTDLDSGRQKFTDTNTNANVGSKTGNAWYNRNNSYEYGSSKGW
jgi:uncharacterized protein YgiM (DUF1202 family)